MKQNKVKIILFVVYLALLAIILLSWKDTESAPPMFLRVLFILASLIPAFLYQKTLLPIIACFSTVSFYGYAHTYFPAELMYILPIMVIISLIKKKEAHYLKKGNIWLLILAFYTAIMDLFTSGVIQPVSMSFAAIYMFELVLDNDDDSFYIYGYALCITSILLSYEFFNVGDDMIRGSASTGGISRVFLRDPNYLGAIISAGAVVAFRELLSRKNNSRNNNLFEKLLFISTTIISFITVVLNASRGAMLSMSLCYVLLLMLYPTNTKYKFFVVIVAVAGIFYLYQNNYFELIQYRIESDSGTGSNRTVIWGTKISTFMLLGSISNIIFGLGSQEGLSLGINAAFHNDFIAVLVEYGIVGFVLFVSFLLRPIFKSDKKNLTEISILVLFLVLMVSTIEPITAGRYAHLFFYVYIEKLVMFNNKKNASVLFNDRRGNTTQNLSYI